MTFTKKNLELLQKSKNNIKSYKILSKFLLLFKKLRLIWLHDTYASILKGGSFI